MRKKSGLTIIEQAVVLVPEFEKVVRKLEQQVTLRGQSKSTLLNYIQQRYARLLTKSSQNNTFNRNFTFTIGLYKH
jgi:hypothetical protein